MFTWILILSQKNSVNSPRISSLWLSRRLVVGPQQMNGKISRRCPELHILCAEFTYNVLDVILQFLLGKAYTYMRFATILQRILTKLTCALCQPIMWLGNLINNSFWLENSSTQTHLLWTLHVCVVCVGRCIFPLELQAVVSCSKSRFVFALSGIHLLDCQRLCVGVVWSGVFVHNKKSWDHPGNFCTNEHGEDKADQRAATIRQSFNSRLWNPQIFFAPWRSYCVPLTIPLSNH